MENSKKLDNASDSILTKFDELANKIDQDNQVPEETAKKPDTDKKPTTDEKEKGKPAKEDKSEAADEAKEPAKQEDETKVPEEDKTTKDTKDKSEKQEETKEPDKEDSEKQDKDNAVEAETTKSDSPKDESETAEKSADQSGMQTFKGTGLKQVDDDRWDKLYEILSKSYDIMEQANKNYKDLNDRINNTESLVKSINDSLVPTVQKAMDLIKDNDDLVDTDSSESPEDVAKKSAELEEKQNATKDSVNKSADGKDDNFAKDSTSEAVDEAIEKSKTESGVSTNNTEEVKTDTNYTRDDYRAAAMQLVGNFNKNTARDLKAGKITKNDADYRNSMTKSVYENTASVSLLKKYIELSK